MEHRILPPERRTIAYFSMEIGIDDAIPTYSGGLGVLAGDTLKAAADLGVPLVGVTLLAAKGYFRQELDPSTGQQKEFPVEWDPKAQLQGPLPARASVEIEGRAVQVQAWSYDVVGATGIVVPVLFLDTDIEGNDPQDRTLTSHLYGGDSRYRLMQEIVLGIGGVRMLRALGYTRIDRHHMNEGHAALLALELFRTSAQHASCPIDDFDACVAGCIDDVRKACVFTTHTPVAAGHDRFPYDLVERTLGDFLPMRLVRRVGGESELNMTLLALNLSHFVNSVAKQHQHVSAHLFPGYQFSSITNGVHSTTWTCESMRQLFDRHIPNWRQDSFELRYALRIPEDELWEAHMQAKDALISRINKEYAAPGAPFDRDVFTIGFARRAATYKRADLLFRDIARLKEIGERWRLQIIFAGKAHPADEEGKALIRKLHWHMGEVREHVRAVYLPDYDMRLAKLLIPGVDLWLNTPLRPKEASGTSGMKAAHNGVPQISIQDGWWMEGHIEGVTGWEIGPVPTEENEAMNDDAGDAAELYDKLDHLILPMYTERRHKWIRVMRNAVAFNASFFNTHRMVQQYSLNAYLL